MKENFNILIVEDEIDLGHIMKRSLKKDGFHVVTVNDNQECLEAIKNSKFHLVLMDIVLPNGNGIELAQHIRNMDEFKETYILFMSGQEKYKDKIDLNIAIGFISKPIRLDDLLERVNLIYQVIRLESSKQQAEIKYQKIINSASDLVFTINNKGAIYSLNIIFFQILKYNISEWIGRKFKDLIKEGEEELWNEKINLLNKGAAVKSFEINLKNKDEEYLPFDILLSKIETDDEQLFFGIAKDLRDKKLIAFQTFENVESNDSKREVDSWTDLSKSSTSVTSKIYEASAFFKNNKEIYNQLIEAYGNIIHKSIDSRIYKMEYDPSIELRELADILGFHKANPKEVIELHSDYYSQKIREAHPKRIKIYFEEARIILLQLMGYLVNYYRNRIF